MERLDGQDLRIRRALLTDVDGVLLILDEAAAWLAQRAVRQWPSRFEAEWIVGDIGEGNTWLVFDESDEPLATVTLTATDPLWPGDGKALYVHRLAVKRSESGLGARLLIWAIERARSNKLDVVRLDCVAHNAALRRYYERFGFENRGDGEVGGAPGNREEASSAKTRVSLYERPARDPSNGSSGLIEEPPVAQIDHVMAAAWPPASVENHANWLLRYTDGVTRRANSVLVVGEPPDRAAAIETAEAFYRARGSEPTFLLSEGLAPESVARSLTERGYEPASLTWMLSGSAERVIASFPADVSWHTAATDEAHDDWFEAYWQVESGRHEIAARTVLRRQLLEPAAPTRFVVARNDSGEPVAVGQVVLADGWGCLQCLATLPAGRRRGAASQVIASLANEALAGGVHQVFAAVVASNHASLVLCARAGLRPSHTYRYFRTWSTTLLATSDRESTSPSPNT